jgi:hypothetical protein
MNKDRNLRERALVNEASRVFDQSVDRLDGSTRSRLAKARSRAVEAAKFDRGGRRWLGSASLVPVGGAVAFVLVSVLVWTGTSAPSRNVQTTVFTDLDILLENQNLDLFEDLEFYAWLLEQPELQEGDSAGGGSG